MELGAIISFLVVLGIIAFGILVFVLSCYKKIPQGKALVRTGYKGIKIAFNGINVVPVIHRMEMMDISLKSIEIQREGKDGLICKDNLRADIKVVFFVRVNNNEEDVKKVAQAIGTDRASDTELLVNLFEAKFSEALKTVGKRFDFVELYASRENFKQEILNIIGTDLNGYVLDDCAIDYLEQTSISNLNPDNIMDSEGIKKITELTASQKIQANLIRNDEVKRIKKQDVEAKETVLELERQQTEAEEKQKREIAIIRSREDAASAQVEQEEKLKAERAKIATDEEIEIAEQNKERQVLVAEKNKERTEVVENERIQKEKELEANEREKVVELAKIDKEKAVEEEKRNIQDVIRERVVVEKAVVEEEEKIKDTKAFAEADRDKKVAITIAEKNAEQALVEQLKAAEAAHKASEIKAKQVLVEANAQFQAAEKQADSKKILADAKVVESAADGLAEAKVMEAKAQSHEMEGEVEARLIEKKMIAEAKGIEVKSAAIEKQGAAEAKVMQDKGKVEAEIIEVKSIAEAKGLEAKAVAKEKEGFAEAEVMKKKAIVEADRIKAEAEAVQAMDGVARELEEFRLNLNTNKEIELAKISTSKDIAQAQADVLSEGLKSAKIDIVGGETMFFEKIVQSISNGKSVDGYVNNSQVLKDVKENLLTNGDGNMIENIKGYIQQFGLSTNDIKNLSVAALLSKLIKMTDDPGAKSTLEAIFEKARNSGIANIAIDSLGVLKA
ncbi:MAG: flotillin family protein [Flammeovirgaceae bacterium]|nr:flotillin family protein [Flammeovirgaceae bacterium]